jgi:hypothetical protein
MQALAGVALGWLGQLPAATGEVAQRQLALAPLAQRPHPSMSTTSGTSGRCS